MDRRVEIKFYLDEHIPPAVASGLRLRGASVQTTVEAQMLMASDEEQLAYAHSQTRVFVTRDEDFLALHARNSPHSGIAFWHSRRSSIGRLIHELTHLRRTVTAELFQGQVRYF